MNTIKWGMIGCGDVTEVKSGPAFNKVNNSALVAVMSRSAERAKDYAERHHVAKCYNDAQQLINDPEVNAVYIATPPGSHEEYTIAALQAGKPVYVEKPMALDAAAAKRMMDAANNSKQKLAVAHYRREQPMFKKIKELLLSKAIGDIRFIDLKFLQQAPTEAELQVPKMGWRVDPAIAGGGLFHDLAPHQLDLILYFFGKVKSSSGIAANQGGNYNADDIVTGNLLFENAIIFSGLWCFNVPKEESMDVCEIVGAEGKISFQVFGDYIINLTRNGSTEKIGFEKLQHVQQPMISKVVEYFLGEAENPCTAEEGVEVMELLDIFTRKD